MSHYYEEIATLWRWGDSELFFPPHELGRIHRVKCMSKKELTENIHVKMDSSHISNKTCGFAVGAVTQV